MVNLVAYIIGVYFLHCFVWYVCRTPDMSAMHHDSTPDLKVVASKLKDVLEVHFVSFSM